ncbi:MAG: phage terminase large subunit family protein [Magnetococcales bacterium]|nr:phage terminase large subunit family protein [Magnetococcales bacterium]
MKTLRVKYSDADGIVDVATVFKRAFKNGLRPEPMIKVSQWADKYRKLSSTASSGPGDWRTNRTPYLREIMDCLSPSSAVERVVFMAGSQLGKTESGLNWLGFIAHYSPGPVLMVQPTVELAKMYSKQRLAPMINSSPALRGLISEPRSRDSGNTIFVKEFPGGILRMVGANSAAGLAAMPVRFLFLDEVDRYPGDVDGEGDPLGLALQRTANFSNKKILIVSTPTIRGFSRIESAFNESDKRRYYVPCPECSKEQVLVWSQIKWPEKDRAKAYYVCIHCEAKIQEHRKGWMLENGRWIAEATGSGLVAGFHLSSLYSPLGWVSWGQIAVEHGQAYRDPVRLKVWVNTKLGESWVEDSESVDGDALMGMREFFSKTHLPPMVALLTAGVDVQGDRLEVGIYGWGRDEECWSIDYRILIGDPSGSAVWQDLDNLLKTTFQHSRIMPDMKISAVCIDTGGHHTLKVSGFVRNRQERKIWGIKGKGGQGYPVWPKKPTKNNVGKIPLYVIGVDALKEAIYSRLKMREPGPGFMHFPMERDAEFFKQLTSESVAQRFHKGRSVRVWKIMDGVRNEVLDVTVYSMAALHGLYALGMRLNVSAGLLLEYPVRKGLEIGSDVPVVERTTPRKKRQATKSKWMNR